MSDRIRHRVVDAFERWVLANGPVPSDVTVPLDVTVADDREATPWRDRVQILLEGRATYLAKRDATLWRSGDIHELLVDYVAYRQVDCWGLAEHGVDAVRLFLLFLADTQRLHPASAKVATLLKELDRAASKFSVAMADTSRWRLAKRVITAMLADGVPLDADDAQVDAWAERLSALGPAGRRRVLGNLIDKDPSYGTGHILIHHGQVAVLRSNEPVARHVMWPGTAQTPGPQDSYVYPAVAVPDQATLAAGVASYGGGLLRELATFAAWVGPAGRPLGRHGSLSTVDVPEAAAALGLPATTASRNAGSARPDQVVEPCPGAGRAPATPYQRRVWRRGGKGRGRAAPERAPAGGHRPVVRGVRRAGRPRSVRARRPGWQDHPRLAPAVDITAVGHAVRTLPAGR